MAVRNTMISKLFSLLLHTFMYCLPRVGVLFSLVQRIVGMSLSGWLPSSGWNGKMFDYCHTEKMQCSYFPRTP